jgi:hypothetical protein
MIGKSSILPPEHRIFLGDHPELQALGFPVARLRTVEALCPLAGLRTACPRFTIDVRSDRGQL